MINKPKTKEEFKNLVKDGIVIFTFTKKTTGEVRKMIGCFDPEKIPNYLLPSGVRKRRTPKHQVCIYDLEMEGWRSFDIDYLENISNILRVSSIEQKKYEYLIELYSYEGKRTKDYASRKRVKEIKQILELLGIISKK